ncbi:MAG: CD1247 N-terminal domain-containing protein [Bacillota bacterium]
MDDLKERAAYIRGLAEGLKIGDDTKEGRVLGEVISLLSQIAEEIDLIHINQAEMEEYMVSLDEDLSDLESDVYEDEDFLEMTCPHCHEELCFDPDLLDDDEVDTLLCPACGETIYGDEEWDEESGQDEDGDQG